MTCLAHYRVWRAVILSACLLGSSGSLFAQSTVRLYPGVAPGSESWSLPESPVVGPFGPIITNVSQPTLTVFRPEPGTSAGTAVIVCPGGAFHFLAMEDEGVKVGQWLRTLGITAFVLKYRVLQTTPDHLTFSEPVKQNHEETAAVFPLAVADARSALNYVRAHAEEFGISPQRVGVIGFSAGAMLTISLAMTSPEGVGPDFVAPLYTDVNELMRPLAVPR